MIWRQLLIASCLLCLPACGDGEKPAPPTGNPLNPTAPKGQFVRVHPTYDVQLKTGEGDANPSVVSWTAKVPTSGWTMKTESILVEDSLGKLAARVWVIIEQPGPDETVTAGEQTLTGEHKDKRKVERLEFSSKVVVRGVDNPKSTLYGVVKTIKYPHD